MALQRAAAALAHDPLLALAMAGLGWTLGLGLAFVLDYAYRDRRGGAPAHRRLALLSLTGAAVAVVAWSTSTSLGEVASTTALGFVFLALGATDFERHLLPNRLLYTAIPLALGLAPWLPAGGIASAALGAALGFVVLLVPYLVAPAALGAGDVKLAALVGAFAGARSVFTALTIGAVAGGIGCLIVLLCTRQGMRVRVAYGPYLILGALLVL